METETQLPPNSLRVHSRRKSFSQFSLDSPFKEYPDQSSPEDDWCKVAQIKTNDKLSIWENERGYQGEIIYLRLTEMLISRTEKLNWESLTKEVDFSEDPGPIFWPLAKLDIAQPAEEGTLTEPEEQPQETTLSSIDSVPCCDEPCSSRTFVKREEIPDIDESEGEAMKTDYEDANLEDENSTEKVVEELLNHFQQRAGTAAKPEELVSIVSISDGSQNQLPIPMDIPVPVDEIYTVDGKRIRLRGSAIWAPPKRKFIFDLPEVRDHQAQLTLQHYRCAGCGMKLTRLYARRAKLCNYYNKLFCQCCFVGEKSKIPSRILHQWNFKEYPVSDLAFRFLSEHEDHAIYNVSAVNPDLLKRVKNLKKARTLRIKASHMWQYIRLCRDAEVTVTKFGHLKTIFTSIPKRFTCLEEVDTYSILDFVNVESGNLIEMLEPIVACGKLHIEGCAQCQQRAFLCQICINPQEFLFSFQLDKVYQCDRCGALSHLKCYNRKKRQTDYQCSRCERIRKKRICQSRRSISTECHSD